MKTIVNQKASVATRSCISYGDDIEVIYEGTVGSLLKPVSLDALRELAKGTDWQIARTDADLGMYSWRNFKGEEEGLYVMLQADGNKVLLDWCGLNFADSRGYPIPATESRIFQKLRSVDEINVAFEVQEQYLLQRGDIEDIIDYATAFRLGDWPEAEEHLLKQGPFENIAEYSRRVKSANWPAAEAQLIERRRPEDLLLYFENALQRPKWPAAEPAFLERPEHAIEYAAIGKSRFLAFERKLDFGGYQDFGDKAGIFNDYVKALTEANIHPPSSTDDLGGRFLRQCKEAHAEYGSAGIFGRGNNTWNYNRLD